MDPPVEEEGLLQALVPAAVGGEHIVVLPEIYPLRETGPAGARFVVDAAAADEDGIREHIHVVAEFEQAALGIIGAVGALDDLPVLVFHRTAAGEEGQGIPGIVVEIVGAEGVVVLVLELHQRSAGLDEVVVDDVVHLVGGEYGPLLHDAHVAPGVDDAGIHVPEGGVADEVGVVVEEGGVDGLAIVGPALLDEFERLGLDEAHQAVPLLRFVLGRQAGAEQQRKGRQNYFLTFSFHPSREKSQSPNMGSMMM